MDIVLFDYLSNCILKIWIELIVLFLSSINKNVLFICHSIKRNKAFPQ